MSRFGGGKKCPACTKSVYANEEVLSAGKSWHKACFRCSACGSTLDSTTVSDHDGKLFCRRCYGKNYGIGGYGFGQGAGVLSTDGAVKVARQGSPAESSEPKFGGAPKCPRCGKSVYMAEKMLGAGQTWHKGCFSCINCRKHLDSTTVADKDGQIYCRACYGREFGPKGVGFGVGGGTLQT
ncbi:cysteine and glycine-rich protein 1-like isoform X1 [Corticium candelabrum]|uniref:cysteine and glycine-rich protein 1-like isoform X1 n=1 Tax=Corticium candelabrum TaxID=121492 RepID=UPI002E25C029|nr:cysteine and glycine-rich protein 1-like isoform X1 [Corticium candelabrum]